MTRHTLLFENGKMVRMPFSGGEVPALRDADSGYVYFEPPSDEELTHYYENSYSTATGDYHTVDRDYEKQKNSYHAGRVLDLYRDLHTGTSPRTALELGCAYGGLVAEMALRGVDVRGSDINSTAIRQGLERKDNNRIYAANNLRSLDIESRKVDLIYSMHALEHDPHMIPVIEKCRHRLSDEGIMFVSVPNAMYIGALLGGFPRNYWAIYPDHLHMLSPGYIPELCRQTGFVPLYWNTNIVFEVEPHMQDHFAGLTAAQRLLWSTLLNTAGHGMEVNMALAPAENAIAKRLATGVAQTLASLEAVRRREVQIREVLAKAGPA